MLSRRSFLIGLGAAAAVVATQRSVIPEVTDTSKLFVGGNWDRVGLSEVSMSMRGTDMSNQFVNYSVYRIRNGSENLLMRWATHPLATMRWVATPDAEIIITKDFPVRFEVEPCGAHSLIGLRYAVKRDKPIITKVWRDEVYIPEEWTDDGYIPGEHIKAGWHITRNTHAHFSETFDVRDGKVLDHQMHALDPEDEHLIKGA